MSCVLQFVCYLELCRLTSKRSGILQPALAPADLLSDFSGRRKGLPGVDFVCSHSRISRRRKRTSQLVRKDSRCRNRAASGPDGAQPGAPGPSQDPGEHTGLHSLQPGPGRAHGGRTACCQEPGEHMGAATCCWGPRPPMRRDSS